MNDERIYLGMNKDEALFLAYLINNEADRGFEEGDLDRVLRCDILLKCITVSLGKTN
jgi:hypothetical protein